MSALSRESAASGTKDHSLGECSGAAHGSLVSGTLLPRSVLDDLTATSPGRRLVAAAASTSAERVRRRATDALNALGPASPLRRIFECGAVPLLGALGWRVGVERAVQERDWLAAPLLGRAHGSRARLIVVAWLAALDHFTRAACRLPGDEEAAWVVLFNGTSLRVLDARRPYAPAYLDIPLVGLQQDSATRTATTQILHPMALGTRASAGLLDDLRASAVRQAAATRAALEGGVQAALQTLGSALVRSRHRGRRLERGRSAAQGDPPRPTRCLKTTEEADLLFQEALTMVFRLLFLLFAEARALVPMWHPWYRQSYSLTSLCAAIARNRAPRGLWATVQAIGRLAHAGCEVGTLRMVAFNGRLFEPALLPLTARAKVTDSDVRDVLVSLATMPSTSPPRRRTRDTVVRARTARRRAPPLAASATRPIAFLDLGVEQLGSVYERVLDFRPQLDGRDRKRLVLVATRAMRKASGSFYTPRSITRFLVRRTLAPLIEDATPDRILGLRILDPAMGSGAFLVEACQYLTTAVERAARRTEPQRSWDDSERSRVRRLVAQRCLFGVDVNPTAVQLAHLSLWLASLAKDRPLSFLEQHLRFGNSLVGASLEDLARPPAPLKRRSPGDGRQPSLLAGPEIERAMCWAVPRHRALWETPDDSAEDVRDKASRFAALLRRDGPLGGWRALADLWCASWFWGHSSAFGSRGTYFDLAAYCIGGQGALNADTAASILDRARHIAQEVGAFHWTLEFPDIFFSPEGAPAEHAGFDAVIGNPPWEVLHREDGTAASRTRATWRLDDADHRGEPGHWPTTREVRATTDAADLARFVRESGQFPSLDGHVNSYGLFIERARQVLRPRGRLGLVLPWGFAADHGVGRLRQQLFGSAHVDTLAGLQNRQGIFPIHRGLRFALLTATLGAAPGPTSCCLGLTDAAALDAVTDAGRITGDRWWSLTPAFLARAGGQRWAVPDIRHPLDARILDHVHDTVPPLGGTIGWSARFGRELHASDDRRFFRDGPSGLPVVDGKHIEPFRMRSLDAARRIDASVAARLLPTRPYDRMRLAYRDVSAPTNAQVLIAAVLPPGVVSTHTLFCLKDAYPLDELWMLCGLLNSSVPSYLLALRISNHVTAAIMHELPVPCPRSEAARALIGGLARRLSSHDDEQARVDLDAACARAYGLSSEQYLHVLTSCRVEPDVRRRHIARFDALPKTFAHAGF